MTRRTAARRLRLSMISPVLPLALSLVVTLILGATSSAAAAHADGMVLRVSPQPRVLALPRMRHPLVVVTPPPPGGAAPNALNPVPVGYTPAQLRAYLGLTGDGEGQLIAVTNFFDNPTIREDLVTFSTTFGLPLPCDASAPADETALGSAEDGSAYLAHHRQRPATEDCFPFTIAMPGGQPKLDSFSALETALDVEWAHAIAPRAGILLVEAMEPEAEPLFAAIDYAAAHGASVISNSWLDDEFEGQNQYDYHCRLRRAICVFPAGDEGHAAVYPATNPYALAVGGTNLTLDAAGKVISEVAWTLSGGGVSQFERRPRYQWGVNPYRMRSSPDVSYHADPNAGFAVYISSGLYGHFGWVSAGGTSAGTPQWAAIVAVADGLRARIGKRPFGSLNFSLQSALYGSAPQRHGRWNLSSALFDITDGANGDCGALCTAGSGYDFITGLGSPRPGIDRQLMWAP